MSHGALFLYDTRIYKLYEALFTYLSNKIEPVILLVGTQGKWLVSRTLHNFRNIISQYRILLKC